MEDWIQEGLDVKEVDIPEILKAFGEMPPEAQDKLLDFLNDQLDKREDKWIKGLGCKA